jgi:uncharacterized damage-inducible protein DinB
MKVEIAKMTYQMSLNYFLTIVKDFEEKDADFAPSEGAMTVVQQIRHTALTVEWFWDALMEKGFNEDFEAFVAETNKPSTLAEAITFFNDVHSKIISQLESMKDEDLQKPLPPNNIMGEVPKSAIVSASADHTAHHRGSLVVYLRMTGKTPKMVYTGE